MSEAGEDVEELLFFDTFSHEVHDELNLDLVQFPQPVYITEVRIIPLGARVEADFPGGVRLGATNPSKFRIEFFVNDLGKPSASTFECLGAFDYNQNDCIHVHCEPEDASVRQIPTDGLVLRGCYTTITLAVYGKLTKAITEPVPEPVPAVLLVPQPQQQQQPQMEVAPLLATGPGAGVADGVDMPGGPHSALLVDDVFTSSSDDRSQLPFEVAAAAATVASELCTPTQPMSDYYEESAGKPLPPGSSQSAVSKVRRYSEHRRPSTDDDDDEPAEADWDRSNRERERDRERERERDQRELRDRDRADRDRGDRGDRDRERERERDRDREGRDSRDSRDNRTDRGGNDRPDRVADRPDRCDAAERESKKSSSLAPASSASSGGGNGAADRAADRSSYRQRTMSHRAASRSSSRERDYHSGRHKRDWSHSPTDYHHRSSGTSGATSSSATAAALLGAGSTSRRTRTTSSYDQQRSERSGKSDQRSSDKQLRTPRTPPASPRRPPPPPRTPDRSSNPDKSKSSSAKYTDKTSLLQQDSSSAAYKSSPSRAPKDDAAKKAADSDAPRSPPPPAQPDAFEPILSDDEDLVLDDDDLMPEQPNSASEASAVAARDSKPATPVVAPIVVEPPPKSPTPEPPIDDSDVDYTSLAPVLLRFDPLRDPLHPDAANGPADAAGIDPLARKEFAFAAKILHKIAEQPFCCEPRAFAALPVDCQEMWVHSAEHLLQALQLLHTHFAPVQRKELLAALCRGAGATEALVALVRCGLDWECAGAQPQPAYKLRHLKIGARLAELLGASDDWMAMLLFREEFDLFGRLFELYEEKYMALSIRLQLLRAVGACLDSPVAMAMESFLTGARGGGGGGVAGAGERMEATAAMSVYERCVRALQANPPTRAKFALRALIKKVNLYEALQLLREIVTKIFVAGNHDNASTDHQLLNATLEEIGTALAGQSLAYQQPRRFLPVAAQFEIADDQWARRATLATFHSYFEAHAFAQTLLVLLAGRANLPQNVLALVVRLVQRLARSGLGLEYLAGSGRVAEVLVRCLTGVDRRSPDDRMQLDGEQEPALARTAPPSPATREGRLFRLGQEIAIRMRTKHLLDAIAAQTAANDADALIALLHSLYSLCVQPGARVHCAATIATDAHLHILIECIDRQRKDHGSAAKIPGAFNNPIIGYALDICEHTVRHATHVDYLAEHGQQLAELVKSGLHSPGCEEATASTLSELAAYLKPLDLPAVFGFDNIAPLCDLLRTAGDSLTQFPGDLITALRLLAHLAIGSEDLNSAGGAAAAAASEHRELRYKFVVLQLYSADGVALMCSLLDTLCAHYEQPHLHRAQLATAAGLSVTHVALPALRILQRMLAYVIGARDAQFRDLSAIETLLRVYALAQAMPARAEAAAEAAELQLVVVQTLLAYTQPQGGCAATAASGSSGSSAPGGGGAGAAGAVGAGATAAVGNGGPATPGTPATAEDNKSAAAAAAASVPDSHEAVHKSLWTQMCGELLKFTASSPCHLRAGLSVLSALLPCALPVLTLAPLADAEAARLVTERQLWSAHLHPKSPELAALLQTVAAAAQPELREVFGRVCEQLADLAPNMSLLVAKAVVELFLLASAAQQQQQQQQQQQTPVETPVGAGVSGANAPTAAQSMQQLQLPVLRLLVRLARSARIKVALLTMLSGKVSEVLATIVKLGTNERAQRLVMRLVQQLMCPQVRLDGGLANALPGKEMVALFVVASVEFFLASRSVVALRAMQQMAAIDLPLFLLRSILDTRKEQLLTVISSLLPNATDHTIDPLCDFLLDFHEVQSEHRTIRLGANDLATVLMWRKSPAATGPPHSQSTSAPPINAAIPAAANASSASNPSASDTSGGDVDMEANSGAASAAPNFGATGGTSTSANSAHPIRRLLDEGTGLSAKVQSKLAQLLALLEQSNLGETPGSTATPELAEPAVATADGIVQQFAGRPVYRVVERAFDECEHRWWPDSTSGTVADAEDSDAEESEQREDALKSPRKLLNNQRLVACDLIEVMKACLQPAGTGGGGSGGGQGSAGAGAGVEPNLASDCKRLLHLSASPQSQRERAQVAPCFRTRRVELEPQSGGGGGGGGGRMDKKIYVSRGRGFARSQPSRADLFRSRPPNTSRPPSLHVDDFLALETCGAQPTGPTGYNKLSRDIISIRGGVRSGRGGGGRGGGGGSGNGGGGPNGGGGGGQSQGGSDRGRMATPNSVYRNNRRTNSPSMWISNPALSGGGGGGLIGLDAAAMGLQQQHFRTATAEPVITQHFLVGGGGGNDGGGGHFGGGGGGGGNGGRGRMRGGSGRMQRPFQR